MKNSIIIIWLFLLATVMPSFGEDVCLWPGQCYNISVSNIWVVTDSISKSDIQIALHSIATDVKLSVRITNG